MTRGGGKFEFDIVILFSQEVYLGHHLEGERVS